MEKTVFISYSHKDWRFVKVLFQALEKAGVRVWLDEHQLKIGDFLSDRITRAISEADYTIVVFSPNSVESEWVKYELSLALQLEETHKQARLLPILLQQVQLPDSLAGRTYADFRTADAMEKGYHHILRTLGILRSQNADLLDHLFVEQRENLIEVRAPQIGAFVEFQYRQGTPIPYVEIGDYVKSGQTLCEIEVFGISTQITAEVSGYVMEILAVNGENLEYDQPLFRIDPDDQIEQLRKKRKELQALHDQQEQENGNVASRCPSCQSENFWYAGGTADLGIFQCQDCGFELIS